MPHGTVKHLERIWWDCIGWTGWDRTARVAACAGNAALAVSAVIAPTSALVGLIGFTALTHIDDIERVRKRARVMQSRGKKLAWTRAVKAELGVSRLARKRVWFRRMCEVLELSPIPQVLAWRPTSDGEEFTIRIVVSPRMGTKEFMDRAGRIRDYAGKDVMRVHITQDPDHGGRIYLRLVNKDLTREALSDWPGLHAEPGVASIVDRILVGRDAGAKDVRLDVVNDAIFVAGQRGTGKSSLLQQIAAGAALCDDVELYLGDLKDGAEFYAWRDRVAMFADGPAAATAMIDHLLQLRAQRSKALTKLGLRKWRPGCGMPFLLCVIDELAELDMDDNGPQSKLTRLIRLGRAQGIGVVVATQRPSADWIDTSLRANCNVAISFRVRDATEANVALGAGAVGAGYLPHHLPKPGVFLILGDDEQTPRRCRAYYLSDADVETIVAKLPAHVPDEATEPATDRPPWPIPAGDIEAPDSDDRLSATAPTWGTPVGPSLAAPYPPEIDTNDARRKVWRELLAHPGWITRGRLARLAEVSDSGATKMLSEWLDGGWVEKRGQQWRRRIPPSYTGNVA